MTDCEHTEAHSQRRSYCHVCGSYRAANRWKLPIRSLTRTEALAEAAAMLDDLLATLPPGSGDSDALRVAAAAVRTLAG
ncbi:MAG TPA: hypothetical protein VGK20_16385 [Candidatus Binatia bacterium]|jgi:hypothetical protein